MTNDKGSIGSTLLPPGGIIELIMGKEGFYTQITLVTIS